MKKLFFLLFTLSILSFTAHKFYISLTNVVYIKETKSVQITMRIFIDDIENELNKIYDRNFNLDSKLELENTDAYIAKYLKNKFRIKINGQQLPFHFLGKKYETDVVYLFSELSNIDSINSIEVQNHLLMDLFPDQQNIIKLNINDKKKTFMLTLKRDKDLLNF